MTTRILLVGDDTATARIIRGHLAAGMPSAEVTQARRLSAALDALEHHHFDVLLLDSGCADLCDRETVTRVHRAAPDTSIILLTSHAGHGLAIECKESGTPDYLLKPRMTEELLVRTIRHAQQRKQLERSLEKSEASYRSLLDNAPHGIFRVDSSGKFLDVNDALVKLLRYETKSDVLGLDVATEVFSSSEEMRALLRPDGGADGFTRKDVQWKCGNGRTITVELSGRVLRDDGQPSGLEVIVDDVTDRRLLEERLLQAQRMQTVGQLTGGIAHELNNVLSVILADAQFIERQLGDRAPGIRRDIEEIKSVATLGGALIKKLLGFSRRQRPEVQTIELTRIVSATVTMLERLFPEHIRVSFQSAPAPNLIETDPGVVEQILLNLATNARDAMPNGGTLEIRIGTETIDQAFVDLHPEATVGDKVVIRVADSGIGMDASTLSNALEPFFTTKSKGEGTGLGLSTVHELIRQQCGFMAIDSTLGEGTIVSLYFPRIADRRRSPRPRPEPVPEPQRGTETILFVEDEPALRRAGQRTLAAFGYSVITAADGIEGLERFRECADTIDLVVTDVVMPGMNGPAMYERIRELKPDVGVVFTSGYSNGDLRRGEFLADTYRLVEKPWSISDLLRAVRTACDARKPSPTSLR